ncbi:glycosyltransferase [Algoriphagus sp.]|uniref:glycosyltransferase n=1 Tax=Algoriphagus sp. TaxID=1872435 RepID=UPI00391A2FD9
MTHLAPIVLFTYNRLSETIRTIEALQNNFLSKESDLFVFSDGSKGEAGNAKVNDVRKYLKTITGFRKIKIYESYLNKGLANSIIYGVTRIINIYGKVIVMEDDLVTSPNFLDFMNQALNFYENDSNIVSISGYTLDLPSLSGNKDFYFGYRASSWGWGTWKKSWENIDWDMSSYEIFINDPKQKRRFRLGGSDMVSMLTGQKNNEVDSWAIRFCFHQFNNNLKTVYPSVSKIKSIGFSKNATNTLSSRRFDTPLDITNKRKFKFELFSMMDDKLVKEFKSKFSIKNRIWDKFGLFFNLVIFK